MAEILKERKLNSKTFNLGNGKRQFQLRGGSIHYKDNHEDEQELWKDIDTQIVASGRPNWDWEVVKGNWHLLIRNDTTIAIGRDGNWLGYCFKGVGYFRPETQDFEILFQAGSVTPIVTDDKIRWENIVSGVNLEYIYGSDGLKENIEITQSARDWLAAHPPSDYGIPNNEAYIGGYAECDWQNAYSAEDKAGDPIDFDNDLDIQDTIFWKHPVKQHIVAFLPIGESTVTFNNPARENDEDIASVPIRKRFFSHNDKHWLLFGSKATDLNSLPAGTIVIDPTTYTNQTATKDSIMAYAYPTVVQSQVWFRLSPVQNDKMRGYMSFDISDLPNDAMVESAKVELWYYNSAGAGCVGAAIRMQRGTRDNWVESELQWRIYKAGSNWTVQGGDYSTPYTDDVVPGSINQWMEWEAKDHVEDAIASRSDLVVLHFRFVTEIGYTWRASTLKPSECGTAEYRPLLSIDYTLPASFIHSQGIMI